MSRFVLQAKTTKKIVLRLACTVCKAQHMHAIKVSFLLGGGAHIPACLCPAGGRFAACQQRELQAVTPRECSPRKGRCGSSGLESSSASRIGRDAARQQGLRRAGWAGAAVHQLQDRAPSAVTPAVQSGSCPAACRQGGAWHRQHVLSSTAHC